MSPLRLNGSTSGYSQLDAPAVAGDQTFTLPGAGGTLLANESSSPVKIDSSGRLLVGTSTSASSWSATALEIIGTTTNGGNLVIGRNDTVINIDNNIGTISFWGNDSSGTYEECARITADADIGHGDGDKPTRLVFSTTADGASSPTQRMRIGSDGVHRAYSDGANWTWRSAAAAGTTVPFVEARHSASGIITGGTVSFQVYTNGNVLNTNNSYAAISDIKLKENIVDANSQWNDLKALQVRNYNFKEGQTHTQIGLVAQEVELVSPGLVSESPDLDAEGNDLGTVTKSVNYSVLYMKAVKALQEAMERIEALETRITTLEAQP